VAEFVRRDNLGTPVIDRVLDLWERTLRAVAEDKLALIDTEIDWAIKLQMLDRYAARNRLDFADPRIAQLDLAYHDIRRSRGLFSLLERRGLVSRVTTEPEIFRAKSVPPQTTRAKLRGDFIRAAQEGRCDYTVDWVHLKLNDQAQRTVLCKDPFTAVDDRVDRLIASMQRG
jgi:proteasome accessory factor A